MMKSYRINLARSYFVSINAEDKESAKRLAEFYVGDCNDVSEKEDHAKHNFLIKGIDLAFNEAMEVDELGDT